MKDMMSATRRSQTESKPEKNTKYQPKNTSTKMTMRKYSNTGVKKNSTR
jgi:hypothetical protein